jgi:hypothetical protein
MSQLTVQLPDPVLSAAKKLAARENVSVEDYVAHMVTEAVRLDAAWDQRVTLGQQVIRQRFQRILSSAADVPPIPGDEIDS